MASEVRGVRLVRVTVCMLVLLAGAPVAGAAEDPTWRAQFSTREPLRLDADLEATAGQGLLTTWTGDPGIELTADRVTVWVQTSQGERVRLPDGSQTWKQDAHEHTNRTFEEPTIRLETWKHPGQLLVEPTPSVSTSATSSDRAAVDAIENQTLAWAGAGGKGTAADEAGIPRYDHRARWPTTLLAGADTAQARGDFTLFVNNVTVEVHEADGGTWRNWTGFRTYDVAGPVDEYELRITRLIVEDGNLSVRAPGAVSLIGDELRVESEGALRATGVEGWLRSPDEALSFEDGSIVLAGQAETTVRAGNTSEETSRLPGGPPLHVRTAGQLEVVHTSGGEPLRPAGVSTDTGWPLGWLLSTLGGVGLVAALGAAVMRKPAVLRPLPSGWTDRLYDRWEQTGLDREKARRFEAAARAYRRLTRLAPERPMGWYLLARAQLEAREPQATLDTIDEAREALEHVPLDIVEFEVAALVDLGLEDEIGAPLEEIGESSPAQARSLVVDLQLEGVVEEQAPAWWTPDPVREGDLDGYV